MSWSDFSKLIKLRLTFLVVFSASISFLIGSKVNGHIVWKNWLILIVGGFLVTAAANCFNDTRCANSILTRIIPCGSRARSLPIFLPRSAPLA